LPFEGHVAGVQSLQIHLSLQQSCVVESKPVTYQKTEPSPTAVVPPKPKPSLKAVTEEVSKAPVKEVKEESNLMLYLLIGFGVLLLIALLVFFLMKGGKFAAAYKDGAKQGLSKQQVTQRLLNQGADKEKLMKFLEKK